MNASTPIRFPFLLPATVLSAFAAVGHALGAGVGIGWLETVCMWLYLPPLFVALVAFGGLKSRNGRLYAAGLVACWVGDTFGWVGFPLLLGAFLVGHLCYVAAMWPMRARSVWATPRMAGHLALLALGLLLVVPHSGGLAAAVVGYGLVLTLMAVLATGGGWAGWAGGLLFMVSDLSLAYLRFAAPDALHPGLRAALVIGTYVAAQVLLLRGFLTLLERQRFTGGGFASAADAAAGARS